MLERSCSRPKSVQGNTSITDTSSNADINRLTAYPFFGSAINAAKVEPTISQAPDFNRRAFAPMHRHRGVRRPESRTSEFQKAFKFSPKTWRDLQT